MKDKNKTIVFISVIIFLFIGLFFFGKPSKIESNKEKETNLNSNLISNKLALEISEKFYDFGLISMKNGNVSKVFQIINSTSEDIKVSSLTTSCMCTTAYILKEDGSRSKPYGMPGHGGVVSKANVIVKANSMLNIEVVYDPNAHGPAGVGLIERSVFVQDENEHVIEFKFRANVTP